MAHGEPTSRDVHPNDDLLLALHDGVLFPGDRPLVEGHLRNCARCRARLVALTEDLSDPRARPATPPKRATSPRVAGSMLRRLAVAVVLLGIIAAAGVATRRALIRRNLEPVTLAPALPAPTPVPAPTITEIPAPPSPEPDAPAADDPAATSVPETSTNLTPASPATPAIPSEPILVTSPNQNFRWRVVGLDVERTTNNGKDWRKQTVELTRQIAAGTAPSAAVCWLVGRGGAVLVAVGSDWKDASLTPPVDLVRVVATDSMNATVTAMDGRQFSTSDAGASWSPVQR